MKLSESRLGEKLERGEEVFWANPKKISFEEWKKTAPISLKDMEEGEERLNRYASFIRKVFPETEEAQGIIESPLREIPGMKKTLDPQGELPGQLFLKMDSHLPVAGSVKARGGIYEVLKHTEELGIKEGILTPGQDLLPLLNPEAKEVLGKYTIQVGSTGNLGLSIGISSAAIGYQVIVHMSADAKQWKKDLLRSKGVTVVEYETDYSQAVAKGREESDRDPLSYFVDDENSKDLFIGYTVGALRLRRQLEEKNIHVSPENPLILYLPCGIGGAPGGIAYGAKWIFGEGVRIYFVEPTEAPCMLLGMMTGLQDRISVQDIGLSGLTEADGLAVGRPSGFVGKLMDPILDGIFTVKDERLLPYIQGLYHSEGIYIEPSAGSAFIGIEGMMNLPESSSLSSKTIHLPWATGGNLVPENIRALQLENRG